MDTRRHIVMLLDQSDAIAALQVIVAQHPLLPAPVLAITPDRQPGIEVRLHGGLADFEAWREALEIGVDAVAFTMHDNGSSMRGAARVGGARVELIGYSGPVPKVAALQAVARW
ncbi:hypothetical protein [Streptomyces sp. SAS_275]|uniref:hypothetical protein n=1 Tax=Streptomyces sp. SAS_275 TaxID=3412746 RepID=UPI00403CAEC6